MQRKPNSKQYKPKRKNKAPIAIQKVLESALKQYGIGDDIARYQFVLHWKDIVGEEIAKRSTPDSLRSKTLVVRVKDSAWAQELSFQKDVILKRLQRFLSDGQSVEDIMFYVAWLLIYLPS